MMLLPHTKGISVAVAGIMVAAFEFIGGNLGMVIAGWATDRLFGSRAHRTCVFCMLGTIVMTIVFWIIPDSVSPWVMAIPFMLIAFFIYGPQALLGIAMSNQATKEASATANGILGVFGYASTLISGVGLGFVADRYGWNSIYAVILVFAVLGLLTLMTIWKAAPDGYAAASEKFTAEYGKISNRPIFIYIVAFTPLSRKTDAVGFRIRTDAAIVRRQRGCFRRVVREILSPSLRIRQLYRQGGEHCGRHRAGHFLKGTARHLQGVGRRQPLPFF